MASRLTEQQFKIVEALIPGERFGKELRAHLKACGFRKSGPAFYQLMARMEEAGLVRGWYDQKIVDGQIIKQRRYKALGKAMRSFDETRQFFGGAVEGGLSGA